MDIKTCEKNIIIISEKCRRHVGRGTIRERELVKFIKEIEWFKDTCLKSELPETIKAKIAEIEINYSMDERELMDRRIKTFLNRRSNVFGFIAEMKDESKRIEVMKEIKMSADKLIAFIQLYYSTGI